MYVVKVGELYVQYISIQRGKIEEVLLRPHYARKFTKDEAYMISIKINGEVIKK